MKFSLSILLKLLITVILKSSSDNSNTVSESPILVSFFSWFWSFLPVFWHAWQFYWMSDTIYCTNNARYRSMLSFMIQTQSLEYVSGMLFLCGIWTSFWMSLLCEIIESHFCPPRFLDHCSVLSFSLCVVINYQMPQGENSCRMLGLPYCIFSCPVSWSLIWGVWKILNSSVCPHNPFILEAWLRFPGFQPLILAPLFSLLILCYLPISKCHEVKHTTKYWTHRSAVPFS